MAQLLQMIEARKSAYYARRGQITFVGCTLAMHGSGRFGDGGAEMESWDRDKRCGNVGGERIKRIMKERLLANALRSKHS